MKSALFRTFSTEFSVSLNIPPSSYPSVVRLSEDRSVASVAVALPSVNSPYDGVFALKSKVHISTAVGSKFNIGSNILRCTAAPGGYIDLSAVKL